MYNACWFLSLIFSLGCALGAILVRQWVLSYSQDTRNDISLPRQVRMRQYLSEGVETWKMATFIEVLPTMLHFALILFFVGLVAFLFEANVVIAVVVAAVVFLGAIVYTTITVLPLIRLDCPYRTPLSTACAVVIALLDRIRNQRQVRFGRSQGIQEMRTVVLKERTPEHDDIDGRALKWLLASLTEGQEFIEFFRSIPSFITSLRAGAEDLRPQAIILDGNGSAVIARIVKSCLHNEWLRPSMAGAAVASLDALLAVAQTSSDQIKRVEWTRYFGHDTWHAIERLGMDSNSEVAIRALAVAAAITTQQLDRSRLDEYDAGSIAECRVRLIREAEEWFQQTEDPPSNTPRRLPSLRLADRLWTECWLGHHDPSFGLFPASGDKKTPWSSALPPTIRHRLVLMHKPFVDLAEEEISQRLTSVLRLYKRDHLVVLVRLFKRMDKVPELSGSHRQVIIPVLEAITSSARLAFPVQDRANAAQLRWFFRKLSNVLTTRIARERRALLDMVAYTCASVLFYDDMLRDSFQLIVRRKLQETSSVAGLLDTIHICLGKVLAMVSAQAKESPNNFCMEVLPAYVHLDAPRTDEAMRHILDVIDSTGESIIPRFLSEDFARPGSAWASNLCLFPTQRDVRAIIYTLDYRLAFGMTDIILLKLLQQIVWALDNEHSHLVRDFLAKLVAFKGDVHPSEEETMKQALEKAQAILKLFPERRAGTVLSAKTISSSCVDNPFGMELSYTTQRQRPFSRASVSSYPSFWVP